jgi:hypothetical protein
MCSPHLVHSRVRVLHDRQLLTVPDDHQCCAALRSPAGFPRIAANSAETEILRKSGKVCRQKGGIRITFQWWPNKTMGSRFSFAVPISSGCLGPLGMDYTISPIFFLSKNALLRDSHRTR